MRWLLIVPIRLYRLLPDGLKRRCLFRETCSLFVSRAATEDGFVAGCRAFKLRFTRCRPPYSVFYHYPARAWRVMLADGSAAAGAEMADFVTAPYEAATALCESQLLAGGPER